MKILSMTITSGISETELSSYCRTDSMIQVVFLLQRTTNQKYLKRIPAAANFTSEIVFFISIVDYVLLFKICFLCQNNDL